MSEDDRIRSKAARLRRIEHRLYNAPSGVRVADLAKDCGVARRTIYRDLLSLEDMGVPRIAHFEGGFRAWKESGAPVASHEPQQVR